MVVKPALTTRKIRFLLWEANVVHGRTVYSYYAFTRRGVIRAADRAQKKYEDWD